MENLEVRVQEIDSRSKSNTKRLDNMEIRLAEQEKLVTSVSLLTNEMTHVKSDVSEMKADVKTLVNKSGKTWDSLKEKILWLVVGGLIAFAFTKIGLPL